MCSDVSEIYSLCVNLYVCVWDQMTCNSMRLKTSSLSWWIRSLTQWWMMEVYLRYTHSRIHTHSLTVVVPVWCQTFSSYFPAGFCQSAAAIQSLATGGAAAAQTHHWHSITEDKSEGKGHSSTHRVWQWQWWRDTGTSHLPHMLQYDWLDEAGSVCDNGSFHVRVHPCQNSPRRSVQFWIQLSASSQSHRFSTQTLFLPTDWRMEDSCVVGWRMALSDRKLTNFYGGSSVSRRLT